MQRFSPRWDTVQDMLPALQRSLPRTRRSRLGLRNSRVMEEEMLHKDSVSSCPLQRTIWVG